MIPKLIIKIIEALDDKKAVNIQLLDMREVVSYTDYVLICTATSTTHSGALMDHVEESVKDDIKPVYRTNTKDKTWLILDYGDIIVHVFAESARLYYDLERLWGDAKRLNWGKS